MAELSEERAGDPLAAALLPVLLHRLGNSTQLLTALNAVAGEEGGARSIEERSPDLARASRSIRELGYVLAVIASASGADLLLERREARGLEPLVGAVRDALRRAGRDLDPPADPLPALAPATGRGWELAWAVGATLWAAGRALAPGEALAWSLARRGGGWVLEVRRPAPLGLRALAPLLQRRLPDARLELEEEAWRLSLPGPWLHDTEEKA